MCCMQGHRRGPQHASPRQRRAEERLDSTCAHPDASQADHEATIGEGEAAHANGAAQDAELVFVDAEAVRAALLGAPATLQVRVYDVIMSRCLQSCLVI